MSEREPISGSSQDYGSTAAVPAVGFAGFSPTELYNLSESIAENINQINSGLRSLEKMNKQIGGPNDNVQLRDKIHTQQQQLNATISSSARDLARVEAVSRRGERAQRLQGDRLRQAFTEALDNYSKVQKQVTQRMSAHMPRPPRVSPSEEGGVADDEEAAMIANQQAQARLIEFESSMLSEREAYLHKIEADVLDVTQVMRDLATMVEQQAETVDTVESHISSAAVDVERGADELAKAAEYQRRLRRKKFFIIIIAAVVAIVFIVWVVRTFR